MKNVTKAAIEKMGDEELRSLMLEIKEIAYWPSLEDTRSCRECVEHLKELFVEEHENENE
jgi:hypothetical protein